MGMFKLPNLEGFEKIREMIAEYVKFSHDAQLTIIKNQHAIHAQLQEINRQLRIQPAPLLLQGPDALIKPNGAEIPAPEQEGAAHG
jgi:hypothetical protein